MTQTTTTITTYRCDLCGYESSGADFYGDKSYILLQISAGDRDVGPSYINLRYAGCNIPYNPNTQQDICKSCMVKYMKLWIKEKDK